MVTPDDVQSLQPSKQQRRRSRRDAHNRQHRRGHSASRNDRSVDRPCQYCGRHHDASKKSCPAYGQTCAKCRRRNHFASVCRSTTPASTSVVPRHQTVNELDADESLLALDTANSKRIYSNVYVNDQKVRFLLDCGSTVNLLPKSFVSTMGHTELRPARATLRMFDAKNYRL